MKYKDVKVINSEVSSKSSIVDFSKISDSKIMDYVEVARNNLIMSTNIGKYTYTGNFTVIQSANIGKFCSISWGVTIGGGQHSYEHFTTHDILYNKLRGFDISNRIAKKRYEKACIIENDVWIGANSVVNRGVKVGNGAIIGAGSVVTKNIPPYAIVVGNPSRILKYRFNKTIISKLEKIAWWNLDNKIIEKIVKEYKDADIEEFTQAMEEKS